MVEGWVQVIKIAYVEIVYSEIVYAATTRSANRFVGLKDWWITIALFLLAIALVRMWRNQRKCQNANLQNRAEIARLERLSLENQQRLNRMMASLPSSVGQDALFNRIRQALATSYARTQNRLTSLEAIDLDSLRIDISQLQADYGTLQESLQVVFQELDRLQMLEQYIVYLQSYQVPQIQPPVEEQPYISEQPYLPEQLYISEQPSLEQQIEDLRIQLANLPTNEVTDLKIRLDALERTLTDFEIQLAYLNQRLNEPIAKPSSTSDEMRVLQVLKQKIQEPEAILHPDQSVELPTGMGVEMRFIKLIKRSDAIALCDKLTRMPDLQVPAATISWVRSRFVLGLRGLETIVYRNRHGGTDRYILLHEAMNLIDDLIREFEANQWRSIDSL
ncbi:MAG: hypothetical protein KME15_12225 [Drouetiella hepatica Uher 2000/2452]|uniref:Uncharacterized protein n=1 Tax=Drouetiella hepatica Uher 2000/2452 TaxID=904376 RepID=A0A951UN33_9CYAN|nr:hypothetical protein [Drouetiella hepatica Uher 2000/2452]